MLSIDDLYLPHAGLVSLAKAHPDNKLLAGRGLPGTHDIPLGTSLLEKLKQINATKESLRLPFFEKSLYDGEGDRVEEPPLDIILFEGWFVGFCPIEEQEINRRYDEPVQDLKDILDIKSFRKEDIIEINNLMWNYVEWWSYFDSFIQVSTEAPREECTLF